MGKIDKVCQNCGNNFIARQRNYKTCSTKCSKEFNKMKQKKYYDNNKTAIIARISSNRKIEQELLECVICRSQFYSRQSTKCCSDDCRSILNNIKSKDNYHLNKTITKCMSCNCEFTTKNNRKKLCNKCIILQKYNAHSLLEASRERKRRYVRHKYKIDIGFRLADNLRSRLNSAIHSNTPGSAVKDLGCTIEELKTHLESKFTEGMSWDNYGRDGWEIDHIEPLAGFNLEDREELLKACHYTNLQPLWKSDNRKKGSK